jgi:hypothetical protein
MVERSRIRFLTAALASLATLGLPACSERYYGAPPRSYPPHHYDYYYYPDVDVYFHIYSGWYYYRDHRHWRRVRRLPHHIHLRPHHRHRLRIWDSEPWYRHEEHRRRYAPSRPSQPNARPVPQSPPQPQHRPKSRAQPKGQPDRQDRNRGNHRMPPGQNRPQAQQPFDRHRQRPGQGREGREHNRREREENTRRHREYRKKPWPQAD